jgi:hypothetical protein
MPGVVGFGVLTAAALVEEELAFADTVIVRESVAAPVGYLECPSALPRTISNSTCRTLSQTDE